MACSLLANASFKLIASNPFVDVDSLPFPPAVKNQIKITRTAAVFAHRYQRTVEVQTMDCLVVNQHGEMDVDLTLYQASCYLTPATLFALICAMGRTKYLNQIWERYFEGEDHEEMLDCGSAIVMHWADLCNDPSGEPEEDAYTLYLEAREKGWNKATVQFFKSPEMGTRLRKDLIVEQWEATASMEDPMDRFLQFELLCDLLAVEEFKFKSRDVKEMAKTEIDVPESFWTVEFRKLHQQVRDLRRKLKRRKPEDPDSNEPKRLKQ